MNNVLFLFLFLFYTFQYSTFAVDASAESSLFELFLRILTFGWCCVSCVECYTKMELIHHIKFHQKRVCILYSVFRMLCHVSFMFSISKVFWSWRDEPKNKNLRECVSIFKKFEYFKLKRLWESNSWTAPRFGFGQKQFEWNNI